MSNQIAAVAFGLGSNLGDRSEMIHRAFHRLCEDALLHARCSRIYESPPWRGMAQPSYLNAVVVGQTEWKPPAVFHFIKTLELALGRQSAQRYAPRVIDIDILSYGDKPYRDEQLEIPHPHLSERDFVLAPWAELWPTWIHPISNQSLAQLLKKTPQTAKVFAPAPQDKENP